MGDENGILSVKRGYLREDFRFFHIKDRQNQEFEFHYHDFNKIIIFLSGKVTYLIEGKAYSLKPWDILFVSSSETHKPVIDASFDYERIVIWVNSIFLEKHNNLNCNLLTCFELASREKFNLLRLDPELIKAVKYVLIQLDDSFNDEEFGSHLLRNSLFIQLMIYLNRLFLGMEGKREYEDVQYDENINSILNYINENLEEDLSINSLASRFFMNKYYLMHRFKAQTGYTIHNYVQQKRLIMAKTFIKKGKNVMDACIECGFGDYSSFIRAFKKMFGLSPKKYYKTSMEISSFDLEDKNMQE